MPPPLTKKMGSKGQPPCLPYGVKVTHTNPALVMRYDWLAGILRAATLQMHRKRMSERPRRTRRPWKLRKDIVTRSQLQAESLNLRKHSVNVEPLFNNGCALRLRVCTAGGGYAAVLQVVNNAIIHAERALGVGTPMWEQLRLRMTCTMQLRRAGCVCVHSQRAIRLETGARYVPVHVSESEF
jgi:hypothetical protein